MRSTLGCRCHKSAVPGLELFCLHLLPAAELLNFRVSLTLDDCHLALIRCDINRLRLGSALCGPNQTSKQPSPSCKWVGTPAANPSKVRYCTQTYSTPVTVQYKDARATQAPGPTDAHNIRNTHTHTHTVSRWHKMNSAAPNKPAS